MSRSQSVEDYLKAIYKLENEEEGGVSNSRLASEMEVSNASVTNMVKRLSEMGMVDYESYYGSRLSTSGRKIALEIIRHHRLLELYLKEMMGYSWDEVHDEAEKLEHHISEQFGDKIAEMLNNPAFDPHGDPIPTKEGEMPVMKTLSLDDVEMNISCLISRVKDQDPEFLRYLEKMGLIPGVKLKVIEKEPFNGPLVLQLAEKQITVGHTVAENIFVIQE
jgi:DtxR family Mn-dependent transcriptional regulator